MLRKIGICRRKTCVLMMVSAVTVALLMMIANDLVLSQVREEAVRQAGLQQERSLNTFWELVSAKGALRIVDGALYAGQYRLSGNNEIPDKVFSITGSRATIFMMETRVATNVLLPDGSRAIGTNLTGPAYRSLFEKGVPYRGEAPILGAPFFTAYDPIRTPDGQIIGALFVGVKTAEYLATYERMSLRIRVINGALAAIFVLFVFLLLNERRRSENAIREQLDFQQILSDTIPSPIFSRDAAGRYSGCNKALQQFLGMRREELIGKTVREVWPARLAERYEQMDRELLESGTGHQMYEWRVRNGDGALRDMVFHRAPIRDQKGEYAGLVGVMLDITQRKAAEAELREAYQRTSDIIEFLPDGTFVVDAAGRVIAWNKAMEEMTGFAKEMILGKDHSACSDPFYGGHGEMLIHYLHRGDDAFRQRYDNGDRKGNTIFGEIRIANYRGTGERIFRASAAPLFDRQGNRAGGIETVRDVTELRRTAQEKQRFEAQMHHSRMMESLLVQLGHDLKTPLTPLFALLPLVIKGVADPKLLKMLEICRQGALQIRGLTDKSLELVRVSSSQSRPELLPLSLVQVAERAVAAAAGLLAGRGVSCENGIGAELRVLGAAEQLELLFGNLLSNAGRYAARNGSIEIAATARDAVVEVSVRDDGDGLEPEHTALIFDEFFKVDEARHDLHTQGLGLSICRRIVVNHGGRIWAQSRGKGEGTTIFFTLPAAAGNREGNP